MAHIDAGELSGYLAYLQGRQKGVTLDQARRWMEIQGHVKSCEMCKKRLEAVAQVERLETRVLEVMMPKSKWDQRIMRMKESATVFEIRMKTMFESAEIRLREAGSGNQWQPLAVRGESSQWEGHFQDEEVVLGAAAGGIYLDGANVKIAVFNRKADGSAGDLIYEGPAQGLDQLDFDPGQYLVIVEE